jgi:catechol 2,3-dioxygenase-like lactoylglutathione lyase family enzyme
MARLVGINHVALEVADLDEALVWYGQFFELELRGRIGSQMAFVDMGDQFIALAVAGPRPRTPSVTSASSSTTRPRCAPRWKPQVSR